jgi:hypothetical protein
MRPLHAVIYSLNDIALSELKQRLILFDSFAVIDRSIGVDTAHGSDAATLDFLEERGIVCAPPQIRVSATLASEMPPDAQVREEIAQDIFVRICAAGMTDAGQDVVGMCKRPPSDALQFLPNLTDGSRIEVAVQVALEAFPMPDAESALDDILDFKTELKNKQWNFRRFLNTLGTKQQTEAEIRDDIEWTLNEYTKAMGRFKLKRSVSLMETYVIPTVEAFENFKPSSFLKGLVAIKKRKIELLESEATAPGRECAYLFDARKRFGGKHGS